MPGDNVTVRVTLGAAAGHGSLEQRVLRLGQGRCEPRQAPCEDVWYVVGGGGELRLGGHRGAGWDLEPDMGVLLEPGTTWVVDNPGAEELVIVSVQVPAVRRPSRPGAPPAVVRLADRPAIPTGDRQFRIMVDPQVGCRGVTQFVGWIPPGRAPAHSHTYDEVVYVLEGEGLLHLDHGSRPIGAGASVYLPAPLPHCLENTATTPLKVLGVFHPPGSPASKAAAAEGGGDRGSH